MISIAIIMLIILCTHPTSYVFSVCPILCYGSKVLPDSSQSLEPVDKSIVCNLFILEVETLNKTLPEDIDLNFTFL